LYANFSRNLARIPCSTPGPVTLTLLASGGADTLITKGLPIKDQQFLIKINLIIHQNKSE
jgi:hypothetical protein